MRADFMDWMHRYLASFCLNVQRFKVRFKQVYLVENFLPLHMTIGRVRIRAVAHSCGSDLWPYKTMEHSDTGRRMGHEAIGVVEAVGADVRTMKVGDVVVMPFAYSDGTCVFCHEGLHASAAYSTPLSRTQRKVTSLTVGARIPR
jgi:D-arabinose 1-dehydrogenase-like Zn-dependent alcohol dehydrogenase